MGTREDILEADDLPREAISIPEWPKVSGPLFVRTMTAEERDAYEQRMLDQSGPDKKYNLANVRAHLAALTLINGDGKRVFADADIPALGKKSAKAIERICRVAQRINLFDEKDIEDLAKNSASPAESSSTN